VLALGAGRTGRLAGLRSGHLCLCACMHAQPHHSAGLQNLSQVRFVASHVRLFAGQQPSTRELPAVVGIPAGCGDMSCAVAYSGRLTAEGLQHFAAAHLLRLPPLQLLSPWLLGAWRWAVPAGNGALLALLPEGQPQPLELLAAVARARGRLQAAAAVWR